MCIYNNEFNIKLANTNKVYNKNSLIDLNFNFKYAGELENPNIKVSLYKKKNLDNPQNQEYLLIDLKNIIDIQQSIELVGTSGIYTVVSNQNINTPNNFSIYLDTTQLEINGYRFEFSLCDGDKIIDVIRKHIIVK